MSQRFDILPTPLAGLLVLQRKPLGDARGYFERLYCREELGEVLPGLTIEQINHSMTREAGSVRGLHFQHPPHAECKLVTCLAGEVFDVAVDLQHNSPTFLHWHAEILSADNQKTFLIPAGFAHGFQTLTGNCEMLYFHTAAFRPEAEGALNVLDPKLAIRWPRPVAGISARDAGHPMLDDSFRGIA
jgi:dTDP-4-dehydrorhamnose 3,5-epimerase